MPKTTMDDDVRLAARIELHHRRVRTAVATRITELADGGLTRHEIAAYLGIPIQLVTLVLRGATLGPGQ